MYSNRRTLLAGLAATTLTSAAAQAQSPASSYAGTYSGVLTVSTFRLRLRLEIAPDGKAVLTSLDQGNTKIPAQSAAISGDLLTLEFPDLAARYVARRTAQGGLEGVFTQRGSAIPLLLAKGEVNFAAPPPPKPVDEPPQPLTQERLAAFRLKAGTPGMAAGWRKGDRKPQILVDGKRSASAEVLVQASDKWHIGSITKSMTSTLAARLVEAGLLTWESSIGAILGARIAGIHPDFASATLLQLLSHQSGLPTGAGESRDANYATTITPQLRAERMRFVQSVLSVKPAGQAGRSFAYANAGYVTAGLMMEAVTGQHWEALIAQELFKPLRLKSAGIGLPPHADRVAQPVGHTIATDGKRSPSLVDLPALLGPAGLVHMNLTDLLAYLAAHRDRPRKFLSSESWDMLHKVHFPGPYALGWIKLPDGTLWHNGSNGAWYADVSVNPASGVIAAYASNDFSTFAAGPSDVLKSAQRSAI